MKKMKIFALGTLVLCVQLMCGTQVKADEWDSDPILNQELMVGWACNSQGECAIAECAVKRAGTNSGNYAVDEPVNYRSCFGFIGNCQNNRIVRCAWRRYWNSSQCQNDSSARVVETTEILANGCWGYGDNPTIENEN